ncbi:MAG: response regulator [candidate division Zixibacteria bacterium]|nr:response regulator [candidate division Zixibacteria bacterium]
MSEPSKGSIRIIAVDDESIVLSLISDALEDEGYLIRTAESAAEALNMLASEPADLVITDIRMPHMNGIEMVKQIRENHPRTGVIFMTGYANLNSAKDAIKHGAFDYIMKPFELLEIRQAVRKAADKIHEDSAAKTSGERLERLSDLNKMLHTAGDHNSISTVSLHFAMLQCGTDRGTVLYWDRQNSQFRCTTIIGDQIDSQTFDDTDLAESINNCPTTVFCEPMVASIPEEHPLFQIALEPIDVRLTLPPWFETNDKMLVVPIRRGESLYGAITTPVTKSSPTVGGTDINLLNMAANQLALSLENLFLLEETQTAYAHLKELQDQTISLEKMATRGEMSAEIGHELNNFLGVVVGNFSLLEALLIKKSYDNVDRHLKTIFDQIERMKRFTTNLMDLSITASQKEIVDFQDLLSEVIDFLKPQKRFSDVSIDLVVTETNIPFEADPTHIQQLLYNIFNNAADATQGCELRQISVKVNLDPDNQHFKLIISDTGIGIEPERLARMFNERFTTKKGGHGFGLMVCKRIVDGHSGQLEVDSIPGEGTTFRIRFPLASGITAAACPC